MKSNPYGNPPRIPPRERPISTEGTDSRTPPGPQRDRAPDKLFTSDELNIQSKKRDPDAIDLDPPPPPDPDAGAPMPLALAETRTFPYPDSAFEHITLTDAPICEETAQELARMIRPGGTIRLRGPAFYANIAHRFVVNALGSRAKTKQTTTGEDEWAITTTVISVSREKP